MFGHLHHHTSITTRAALVLALFSRPGCHDCSSQHLTYCCDKYRYMLVCAVVRSHITVQNFLWDRITALDRCSQNSVFYSSKQKRLFLLFDLLLCGKNIKLVKILFCCAYFKSFLAKKFIYFSSLNERHK